MAKWLFILLTLTQFASAQVIDGTDELSVSNYASGLNRPWAIEFAKDGRLFVSEKTGRIRVFAQGRELPSINGIPQDLEVVGQGGLLDLKVDPDFLSNGFIYISYTTMNGVRPRAGAETRVSRFRLRGNSLTNEKVLVQGGFGEDGAHFGCRLAIDSNGFLFATFGERHQKELAQDLNFLNGKVIRIHKDGTVPRDNPFFSRGGKAALVYTFGHRNPQGIDIHPSNQLPMISEHGPTGYDAHIPGHGDVDRADEVNRLLSGRNYGWPVVYGDPNILPWTDSMKRFRRQNNVVMPVQEFTLPDGIAPSGATFYSGKLSAKWKNNFFVAALRGYVVRMEISESGQLIRSEKILDELARVRDVTEGPDGALYVLEDLRNQRGRVVRVLPEGGGADSNDDQPDGEDNGGSSEISRLLNEKRCMDCHSEFDDLNQVPEHWRTPTVFTNPIYRAVRSGRMPIGGAALNDDEVEIVKNWLESIL